jgi:hypothetical protein
VICEKYSRVICENILEQDLLRFKKTFRPVRAQQEHARGRGYLIRFGASKFVSTHIPTHKMTPLRGFQKNMAPTVLPECRSYGAQITNQYPADRRP